MLNWNRLAYLIIIATSLTIPALLLGNWFIPLALVIGGASLALGYVESIPASASLLSVLSALRLIPYYDAVALLLIAALCLFQRRQWTSSILVSLAPGILRFFIRGSNVELESFLFFIFTVALLFFLKRKAGTEVRGLIIAGLAFLIAAAAIYGGDQGNSVADNLSYSSFYYLVLGTSAVAAEERKVPRVLKRPLVQAILAYLPATALAYMSSFPRGQPYYYWTDQSFYFRFSNIFSLWIPGIGVNPSQNSLLGYWALSHALSRFLSPLSAGIAYVGLSIFLSGFLTYLGFRILGIPHPTSLGLAFLYQVSFVNPSLEYSIYSLPYALLPFGVCLIVSSAREMRLWKPILYLAVTMVESTDLFLFVALLLASLCASLALKRSNLGLFSLISPLGINGFWTLTYILLLQESLLKPTIRLGELQPLPLMAFGVSLVTYYIRGESWIIGPSLASLGLVLSLLGAEAWPLVFLASLLMISLSGKSGPLFLVSLFSLSTLTVLGASISLYQRPQPIPPLHAQNSTYPLPINVSYVNSQIGSRSLMLTQWPNLNVSGFNPGLASVQPFATGEIPNGSIYFFVTKNGTVKANSLYLGYPAYIVPPRVNSSLIVSSNWSAITGTIKVLSVPVFNITVPAEVLWYLPNAPPGALNAIQINFTEPQRVSGNVSFEINVTNPNQVYVTVGLLNGSSRTFYGSQQIFTFHLNAIVNRMEIFYRTAGGQLIVEISNFTLAGKAVLGTSLLTSKEIQAIKSIQIRTYAVPGGLEEVVNSSLPVRLSLLPSFANFTSNYNFSNGSVYFGPGVHVIRLVFPGQAYLVYGEILSVLSAVGSALWIVNLWKPSWLRKALRAASLRRASTH